MLLQDHSISPRRVVWLGHKVITVQTVLVCGSQMVEQATKCYQSNDVHLHLLEPIEILSLINYNKEEVNQVRQ